MEVVRSPGNATVPMVGAECIATSLTTQQTSLIQLTLTTYHSQVVLKNLQVTPRKPIHWRWHLEKTCIIICFTLRTSTSSSNYYTYLIDLLCRSKKHIISNIIDTSTKLLSLVWKIVDITSIHSGGLRLSTANLTKPPPHTARVILPGARSFTGEFNWARFVEDNRKRMKWKCFYFITSKSISAFHIFSSCPLECF